MFENFKLALCTERIKIKRSGIFTLGWILALIMPLLYFTIRLFEADAYQDQVIDTNYYYDFFNQPLQGLTGFFLPLLVIITASKIAQIDHKNKGWQLMEMQPISKFAIYFSKFFILCINILLTIFLYALACLTFAFIYSLVIDIHPTYDMHLPIEDISYACLRVFIASIAILAFQYALSVIIPGFIWSLVIGFAMLLAQLFAEPFQLNLNWYPYNFLFVAGSNPKGGFIESFLLPAEWLSLIYSVFFLFIGFYWYRFKGFYSAFAKAIPRTIIALFVMVICSGMAYYLITPKTLEPFHKTVVKGTINADKEIKNVFIRDIVTSDTIAKIPVDNNAFRYEFTQDLAPQFYNIIFDKYNQSNFFMSSNDSIQIDETLYGKSATVTVLGTRILENAQEVFYGGNSFSYVSYQLDNNMKLSDPEYYMDKINEEYEEDLSKLKSKISVDHIIARDDFLNRSKKLIAVKFINKWNSYLKKKAIYNPEVPVVLSPQIEELLNAVSYKDETLLSDQVYIEFIKNDLIDSNRNAIDNGTSKLELIAQLDQGAFKDKMLFSEMRTQLNESNTIDQRDSIYSQFIATVNNDSYIKILDETRRSLNKLSRGQDALNFISFDKDGNEYTLQDFNGKYVLIDTWASWCAPCKAQEPYYVKKMIKYKKENIVFTSMNIDVKKKDWLEDLIEMNKDILQLRPKNINLFSKLYNIDSIPRFILIAPDGTIDDADFTRPMSNAFDDLLDAKLGVNVNS